MILYLLIRIIHVVVDGVNAGVGASITTNVASAGRAVLNRSVVDVIAGTVTSVSLAKSVDEVAPVSYFMDSDSASAEDAVSVIDTARGSPCTHDTSIVDEVIRALRCFCGIVAVSSVATTEVSDVVKVQRSVIALAKCLLHDILGAIVRPVVVDSPVNILQSKLEACALVVLIEYPHLLVDSVALVPLATCLTKTSGCVVTY